MEMGDSNSFLYIDFFLSTVTSQVEIEHMESTILSPETPNSMNRPEIRIWSLTPLHLRADFFGDDFFFDDFLPLAILVFVPKI